MDSNKALELAKDAYPNDENLRVAYMLGVDRGYELHREDMMKDGNVILAEEDFDAEKEKSMEWGYNLCKEQMLKDAVEGEVGKDGILTLSNGEAVDLSPSLDKIAFGLQPRQKVRIIVLKEEEEYGNQQQ